jgi:hypothetical protein
VNSATEKQWTSPSRGKSAANPPRLCARTKDPLWNSKSFVSAARKGVFLLLLLRNVNLVSLAAAGLAFMLSANA